ncbi:MAG: hypothetical protein AUJ57_10915 [Zetaproteobacteria bacterium CG1_02_53_45]|nr:MAG: hypothetical protein AUJ57_10915 [Zetaproteobacteria bacterium CG1_02_53_45]
MKHHIPHVFRAGLLPALLLVSLLGACGGSHKLSEPENPYRIQASNHIHNGLTAIQYERWQSAERSFERALTSAQLADDLRLVCQSWYNLAIVRSAQRNTEGAITAYLHATELAELRHDTLMQMRARLALALLQQREARLPDTFKLHQLPANLFQTGSWPADIHLQAARLAQLLQQKSLAQQAYLAVTANKGSDRNLLKMKAEAHMGFALLARSDNSETLAWSEAELTLELCRKIGAPRLTAHALLLQGQLAVGTDSERKQRLERALDIYTALKDGSGQKQALTELIRLSLPAQTPALQLRLQQLEDKLGKQAEKAKTLPLTDGDH